MKITIEKLDDINYLIKGAISNDYIEELFSKKREEIKENIKNKDLNSEEIEQVTAAKVFQDFINEGIKEAKVDIEEVLGQPSLKKYEHKNREVFLEVEFAIDPKIDVGNRYKEAIPTFSKPNASPESIEERLNEFLEKNAPYVSIKKPRALKKGDIAVIDFTGYIDDKEFEGGSAKNFNLKIGSNSFIGDFEEQLTGMMPKETRKIKITFPKEYQSKNLAGKEACFNVTLNDIKEQVAQEPTDEYIKSIMQDDSATLEKLKESISEQAVADELSKLYTNELRPKIVNSLLRMYSFTLPKNIVEQEIDAMIKENAHKLSEEEHKELMKNREKFLELRDSYKKEAQDRVKLALIVEAIAKKEGVQVDDQELQAALAYQAMVTGQDANELFRYYEQNNLINSAKMGLLQDKLFGTLLGFDKQN